MQLVDVQILLERLFSIFLSYHDFKPEISPIADLEKNDKKYESLESMEEEINTFYSSEDIRHKYSSVYSFILSKYEWQSYELSQFIESLDYIRERGNLNSIAANKFLKLLDHIELENLKIINLYKIDDFTILSNELHEQVKNINKKEREIERRFNKAEMDIKTIKIDFIGILSSILSLFTIFGLNSSIISTLINKAEIDMCCKICIFIGANVILMVCIFTTLYFIKNYFMNIKMIMLKEIKNEYV